jgi:hypothetical protein
MSTKKVKTELHIPPEVLKDAMGQRILELEKKVKSLEARVRQREGTIQKLRSGVDLSAERRKRIRDLSEQLFRELDDSRWIEIDEYYEL